MKAIKNTIKRLFVSLALSTLAFSTFSFAASCVDWQPGTFVPDQNTQGQKLPAYGLYWFNTQLGSNLTPTQSVMPACTSDDPSIKAMCMANLQRAGYFDPSRPTIIFIHGWQPDTVVNQHRYDFCYQYSTAQNQKSAVYNTLQPWAGWNVGVFYWNQFADEADVTAAEAKIYSTTGKKGMRWAYDTISATGQTNEAYCESSDSTCVMPKGTIADMAYTAIEQGLPSANQYSGSELRIAGHSLGAQIAIQVAGRIFANQTLPQPTRLVLMDPYFSDSVVQENDDIVNHIIADHPNLPIAVYRTSNVSFAPWGNPNWDLMTKVAYMRMYPQDYIKGITGLAQLGADHAAASYLYFISKEYQPEINPAVQQEAKLTNTDYIDADSSDQDVRALMGQQRYEGAITPSADSLGAPPTYAQTWTSHFTNQAPLDPRDR